MDKAFENMDKRFKNIEEELNYNYDSSSWHEVNGMLGDKALDDAFVTAASSATVGSAIDFSSVNDAFLDSAFIDATNQTKVNYQSSYFTDFKNIEADLIQNDSFVHAASVTSAIYSSEYWGDANLALQTEGLHHEYKSGYWKEAERLLLKDQRKAFFWKWGAAATILILLSFIGFNLNQNSENNIATNDLNNKTKDKSTNNIVSIDENSTDEINNEKSTTVVENAHLINSKENAQEHTAVNQKAKQTIDDNSVGQAKNNTNDLNLTENNSDETEYQNKSSINNEDSDLNKSDEIAKSDVNENDNSSKDNIQNKKASELDVENTQEQFVQKMSRDLNVKLTLPVLTESLIANKIDYTKPLVAVHQFGIKMEKGLGNSFGSNNAMISPRNSMYIDYRFKPAHKFENVEFGFDFGMYHMNLDNYELERNYSVYTIEGGVEHFWYKMTYKDLIFMSTKFNTYFNLGSKSKLRLGIGVDRLMTSRIRLEYNEKLTDIPVDAGDEWGVNDGINKMDFNFGLGYELKLNSKFSFLIDSRIGMADKTNNEYLKVKRNDRDVSLQFGIKYNIFATHINE